jgi:hypothetical protein
VRFADIAAHKQMVSAPVTRLSRNFFVGSSRMGCCDLQAELGCFLSEELDLLLAVSSLVVFGAFVDVLLPILEHSIDQSG